MKDYNLLELGVNACCVSKGFRNTSENDVRKTHPNSLVDKRISPFNIRNAYI